LTEDRYSRLYDVFAAALLDGPNNKGAVLLRAIAENPLRVLLCRSRTPAPGGGKADC